MNYEGAGELSGTDRRPPESVYYIACRVHRLKRPQPCHVIDEMKRYIDEKNQAGY